MAKKNTLQQNGAVMKPAVDKTQEVKTQEYVPKYKLKPQFKSDVLKAIGKHPYNQIAGIMNAVNTESMDHNVLQNVLNALGSFPFIDVAQILQSVNSYVEPIMPESQDNPVDNHSTAE